MHFDLDSEVLSEAGNVLGMMDLCEWDLNGSGGSSRSVSAARLGCGEEATFDDLLGCE